MVDIILKKKVFLKVVWVLCSKEKRELDILKQEGRMNFFFPRKRK